MRQPKILVITRIFGTFVRRDLEILEKKFKLKCHKYSGNKNPAGQLLAQVRLFFWLLWHIPTSYAVYVWFADYHAYLPVLFAKTWKKRSFVVEGGYDTVAMPEINYGSHINPLRSKMSTYAMRNATLNLPVSETLEAEILELIPEAKVQHLYTGYDPSIFKAKGTKEPMVLTVANGNTEQRIKLKGIDVFIAAAKRLPEYHFVIIGLLEKAKALLGTIPDNVEILEEMPQEKLLEYYQRAKVYAQFSMREGLPNVVCEAMACECVPVGFANGGIPVAIGDAGFVSNESTVDSAVTLIKQAMNANEKQGKIARGRIIEKFSHKSREENLLNYITGDNP